LGIKTVTFGIIIALNTGVSCAGMVFSGYLLWLAPECTNKSEPNQTPIVAGWVVIGIGMALLAFMMMVLACNGTLCGSPVTPCWLRIVNLTVYLNTVFAVGAQIAYVGYGDFATSHDPAGKFLECASLGCAMIDVIVSTLLSFLPEIDDTYHQLATD